MTLARPLAERLVAHAAAVMPAHRSEWALGMRAELASIDHPGAALIFAAGCAWTAYRQRMDAVTVLAFLARLGTALAAGLFGLLHVTLPWSNLALKLKLLADPGFTACGARCGYWVRVVGEAPLGHWLWQQVAMAAFGTLHIAAAVLLLRGWTRGLARTGALVAVSALAMPLLDAGGITFPAIYILQIAMMVAVGFGLARLEHRRAHRRTG